MADDQPSTSIVAAVDRSLTDLPRKPRDEAAVAALRLYATLLDDTVDRLSDAAEEDEARNFGRMVTAVTKIGPRFERMIDMLGMAPGSRPTAPQGGENSGGDPASAALAELRAGVRAVAARLHPPAALDPAVADLEAGE
jgi:hypothetical protein